eukprot:600434-Heterocapsa_arctica.AAC.1
MAGFDGRRDVHGAWSLNHARCIVPPWLFRERCWESRRARGVVTDHARCTVPPWPGVGGRVDGRGV